MWKFNFQILPVCQSSEKVPMTRVQSTTVHCSPNCVMSSCAAVLLSAIISGQFKAPSSRVTPVTHLIHLPYWVISWTIASILHSIRRYGSGGWNFVDTFNVKCYDGNVQAFVFILFHTFALTLWPKQTVDCWWKRKEMEFLVGRTFTQAYCITWLERNPLKHNTKCSVPISSDIPQIQTFTVQWIINVSLFFPSDYFYILSQFVKIKSLYRNTLVSCL